jgi:hypothetical protein
MAGQHAAPVHAKLAHAVSGPVYALKSQKLEARARSLLLDCKSYTEFCGQKAELARSVFIHEMNTARLIGVRQGGSSGVRGGGRVCADPDGGKKALGLALASAPPPEQPRHIAGHACVQLLL